MAIAKFNLTRTGNSVFLGQAKLPIKPNVMSEKYVVVQAVDAYHAGGEHPRGDMVESTTSFDRRRELINAAAKKAGAVVLEVRGTLYFIW